MCPKNQYHFAHPRPIQAMESKRDDDIYIVRDFIFDKVKALQRVPYGSLLALSAALSA